MDRQFAVAVVGATGLVGEMMINVLDERHRGEPELLDHTARRGAQAAAR